MRKKAAELYDGKGDTEFGDAVFDTVWTAIQNNESGTHKKGLNGVDAKTGFDAGTGDYSSAWLVQRDWDNRTSLIIDPPNGRLPEMTAAGKKRLLTKDRMTNLPEPTESALTVSRTCPSEFAASRLAHPGFWLVTTAIIRFSRPLKRYRSKWKLSMMSA